MALVVMLLSSVAFWWPIVEPVGLGRGMSGPIKLGYILLATIPQTLAGLMYALSRHVFYAGYAAAPRAWGLSPLADQQIAGACLALVSKIALFAAFTVVFLRLVTPGDGDELDDQDEDDGGTHRRDGPDPGPSGVPAWVTSIDTVEEPAVVAPGLRHPAASPPPVSAGRPAAGRGPRP
jgi:hypothetical protein